MSIVICYCVIVRSRGSQCTRVYERPQIFKIVKFVKNCKKLSTNLNFVKKSRFCQILENTPESTFNVSIFVLNICFLSWCCHLPSDFWMLPKNLRLICHWLVVPLTELKDRPLWGIQLTEAPRKNAFIWKNVPNLWTHPPNPRLESIS